MSGPVSESPGTTDTGHVRILKLVVAVLGLLLVIAFGTVIARMIYLASQPERTAMASPSVGATIRVALPNGANVRHTALTGDRLAVTYDTPQHMGTLVISLTTGQVLSRIEFVTELPRQ